MKRLVISEFDEAGSKWCNSPHHKELKTGFFSDQRLPISSKQESDGPTPFPVDNKLRRDKFYDFFRRATINGEPRINMDELNKNLTMKIDELPESSKISVTFEELDSKSSLASRNKKNWSEQEISFFVWLVMNYCYLNKINYMDISEKEWEKIAEIFPGRSGEQCKLRWQSLLKMNLSKAPWTQEEDDVLVQVINDKGPKKWKEIAIELNKRLGNLKIFRQGKQCRERWINHLDPAINRGAWSSEEDIKLLQTHMALGKRWAEIAKILRTRTENAVKNRWNSLIKKYRSDYGLDSDAISDSSNQSNSSMNDLEKKISELIINQKMKRNPGENSPDSQLEEVPEENENDSNDDDSEEPSLETSIKNEAQPTLSSDKKIDEEKPASEQKKMNLNLKKNKKPNGLINVAGQRSALMDMVTKDMGERNNLGQMQKAPEKKESIGPLFPQMNNNIQDNMNLQNLLQANLLGLNHNNNFQPNLLQQSQDAINNANTLSLLNQLNPGGVAPFSSMANDLLGLSNLGIWKSSPNSFNGINGLLNQNMQQQNDLAANILNLYGNRNFPQTSSSLSSLLPNSQNFLPEQQQQQQQQQQNSSMPSSLENLNNVKTEKKQDSKISTEEKEATYHKLLEKPIDQLNIPDNANNSLQHAIVDTENGHIYFLSPINKDSLLNKNRNSGLNGSFNALDILGSSPALNRSWTSPNLNANNLFNNSLNQQLANLALTRPSISPQLGLLHDSPGINRVFLEQNFNNERRSNEWTPESNSRTPISILNNRNRVITQIDQDKVIQGNAAGFAKRPTNVSDNKSKNSSFSTNESSKFDSPSSFLENNQLRGLAFKAGEAGKLPVRQLM